MKYFLATISLMAFMSSAYAAQSPLHVSDDNNNNPLPHKRLYKTIYEHKKIQEALEKNKEQAKEDAKNDPAGVTDTIDAREKSLQEALAGIEQGRPLGQTFFVKAPRYRNERYRNERLQEVMLELELNNTPDSGPKRAEQ